MPMNYRKAFEVPYFSNAEMERNRDEVVEDASSMFTFFVSVD